MAERQTGHLVSAGAHIEQHAIWPHGMNTMLMVSSIHTLHCHCSWSLSSSPMTCLAPVENTMKWLMIMKVIPVLTPWSFRPKGYCRCLILSVCQSVRPSTIPYPHDNSSQIWTGITKFAPNMHHGLLSVRVENGGHWLQGHLAILTKNFRKFGLSAG